MAISDNQNGLASFGLTIREAVGLPRGKRRSVVSYLLRFGWCAEARAILTHVVNEDPSSQLYRAWLVNALLGCGEIDEAERVCAPLVSGFAEGRHSMTTLAQGQVALTRGDLSAALDIFKGYVDRPEDNFSYWAHVGEAAQLRGEWETAGEALDRSMVIFRRQCETAEEEYSTPFYLWMALARQEEHSGAPGQFCGELEQMRVEAEEKLKAELAKPTKAGASSSSRRAPAKTVPNTRTSLSGQGRSVDPDVEAALAAGNADPEKNPGLEADLHRLFGFSKFRPGQQSVVEWILQGMSVLAVMPTGAGKSLCYQLPAMLLPGVTLVVSPLIALMKDQLDGLPADVQTQATLVNSTLEGDEIERRLCEIAGGKYKLVYAAPERLRQTPFLHALRKRGVSLFVVDEAHCVSMWGHDFRPDYLFIGEALSYLGNPTVLAMTATATPKMRLEIANYFGRHLRVITTGTYRSNLFLESVMVANDEEKMRKLISLCDQIEGTGIVYTRSRQKAEELSRLLRRHGVKAVFYHAGMDRDERAQVHEEFMDGRWRVICATVAFGMGIDKSDVRFVIHYSLPQSLEDYYQEAGRAGRDGLTSRCILMFTSSDKASVTRWMRAERVNVELPRRCYEIIRGLTRLSPFTVVNIDEFVRNLGHDETQIRVGINMLESVELVKRHFDVPTSVTVTLTAKGANAVQSAGTQVAGSETGVESVGASGDGFGRFVTRCKLKVNEHLPMDSTHLARQASIALSRA